MPDTNEPRTQSGGVSASPSSPILIAAAWLIVILPTAWGFSYTVQNALKIFDRPAAAAPATTPK